MAKYVDGFVFSVPNDKFEEYKKMAEGGAKKWKEFGALQYYESKGEDLAPKEEGGVKQWSFPDMAQTKPDETVWFSFIVFKDKAHRDEVNKKVMDFYNEEYGEGGDFSMPFDMRRFSYGGFDVIVEA